MAARTNLEELYTIEHDKYTTGSESLDGLLIGLATWLLIRSSEFIALDLLTLFYGNRKHRTGYRVLRIWQLLNICHFYKIFTGVDTDLRFKRFRTGQAEEDVDPKSFPRLRVRKGRFMPLLVFFVSVAKLLSLGAEVAIIAFVIPVATVHRIDGGLGLTWRNVTITQASLKGLSTCEQILTSDDFSETAQLGLCKRVSVRDSIKPTPEKWIPNGSLRLEYITYTPENMRHAGAVFLGTGWGCNISDVSDVSDVPVSSVGRLYSKSVTRQISFAPRPDADFSNDLSLGEITVLGESIKTEEKINENFLFGLGSAAVLPIFNDAKRMIRLSFVDLLEDMDEKVGRRNALTLNGKLLIGGPSAQIPGNFKDKICPDALNEIIRVTGTLHPGMIIDILRSGMTVFPTANFTEPSPDSSNLRTTTGFEVGTSRKFRIPPEWMVLAAGLAMLTSALTSRLNRTEANMARVYREHNNMYSACAPSHLEEELVVEGALFQKGDEYHWGHNTGKSWEQVSSIARSAEGALV